jgi:MFS family permease
MLTFSGLGSLLSTRLSRFGRRGLAAASLAVALTLVCYRFGLDSALGATLAASVSHRIALALAMLALPSTLMGMPFPAAVAALGEHERASVVRAWVVNGYFSVLGACLAMVISISFGFGFVLLTGAAIYGLAAVVWPDPEAKPS